MCGYPCSAVGLGASIPVSTNIWLMIESLRIQSGNYGKNSTRWHYAGCQNAFQAGNTKRAADA